MYCPASVRREESNDKGQRVLPLIGGLSVMAFCSSPPWLPTRLHPAWPSQVSIRLAARIHSIRRQGYWLTQQTHSLLLAKAGCLLQPAKTLRRARRSDRDQS
jgi:hypothetical protein